jgi:hypothetical protein
MNNGRAANADVPKLIANTASATPIDIWRYRIQPRRNSASLGILEWRPPIFKVRSTTPKLPKLKRMILSRQAIIVARIIMPKYWHASD